MTAAVALLFAAFVASATGLIVGDSRLVLALRRNHPRVWEALGRPSPWFSRVEDVGAVHRFLHQRAYVALGDAALIRLGDRLRALTIVTGVLGIATLALAAAARR